MAHFEVLYKLVRERQSKNTVHQIKADVHQSTRLYSCLDYEAAYVSDEMKSRSECNVGVKQIRQNVISDPNVRTRGSAAPSTSFNQLPIALC